MKKKISIICSIFVMLFHSGCEDWLNNMPPDGLVFDEFWETKENVQSVIMGAYNQLTKMDEKLFIYGEIRGDMVARTVNTPTTLQLIISGNLFPENTYSDWSDFYKVINYCNNVIKYAPEVRKKDITFTEIQMQSFISEATVIRALMYFYLVRIFKDVPFVLEPSDNDNVNFFLPKTDGDIILRAIKEDLLQARLVSDYGNLLENKGRITPASVNALLADICLWNFEYEEALIYLDRIINSGKYFLQPSVSWFEIFNPGNSLEGIFELQFDDALGQRNTLYSRTWVQNQYASSEYTIEILALLDAGENIRGRGSVSREQTGYRVWKYAGALPDQITVRPSSSSGSANFILYRYADILLMRAEALSQLERYGEALSIINEIRARALMSPVVVGNTPDDFETAILLERAKELAFEGKRWFDLLRMARRNDYANKGKLIEILIRDVPSTQKLVLATKLNNPYGWYFPISSSELEQNKELVQNPYYAN